MSFTLNDFFCGGGGLGIGFKQAGFEILGSWDWDPKGIKVGEQPQVASYRHNVEEHILQQDIKTLTSEDLPQASVWSFGFPCQDLTKNGKRKGLRLKCDKCEEEIIIDEDVALTSYDCLGCGEGRLRASTRSGMFFEIMRLLDETPEDKRPSVLLAENVSTLKSLLPILEKEYQKRGYRMQARLLNSKFLDVPQNRERYFVVGIQDGIDAEFIYPEMTKEPTAKLLDILEDEADERLFIKEHELINIVNGEIRVTQATKQGYIVAEVGDSINLSMPKSKTRRGRVGKGVAQTLLTSLEQAVVLPDRRIRYFTPREALRIQSFPDSYEMVVSDEAVYHIAGNAVSCKVAQAMAENIKILLQEAGKIEKH